MINRSVIAGRLVKDPELKKTYQGHSVTNFTVAVQDDYNPERTHFINCVAWGKSAEFVCNYLLKGDLVGVDGKLESRTYENKMGQTVYVTEINADRVQAMESRLARETRRKHKEEREQQEYEKQFIDERTPQHEEKQINISSDDLPF